MTAMRDRVLLAPEIDDSPSGYIDELIAQAQAMILEYTRLSEWPDDDATLDAACVRLAIAYYRRGGAEHASTVSMGGLSITSYEIPPDILVILRGKRRITLEAE